MSFAKVAAHTIRVLDEIGIADPRTTVRPNQVLKRHTDERQGNGY